MAVVTALRATRAGRVAVHLDGAYACTVTDALLVSLGLFAGRPLTDEQVEQLHAGASAERALVDAYRLLAHRPRAGAELRSRLAAKGHPETAVTGALATLQERGLIDDGAFARAYVADRRRLDGWGTERIARELGRLGTDPAAVQAAIAEAEGAGEGPELERARQSLAKLRPGPSPQADKRRAYQLLLRRGFSTTIAYDAVRLWASEASDEADDSF